MTWSEIGNLIRANSLLDRSKSEQFLIRDGQRCPSLILRRADISNLTQGREDAKIGLQNFASSRLCVIQCLVTARRPGQDAARVQIYYAEFTNRLRSTPSQSLDRPEPIRQDVFPPKLEFFQTRLLRHFWGLDIELRRVGWLTRTRQVSFETCRPMCGPICARSESLDRQHIVFPASG
jgi:hypothetical protein